MRKVFTALGVFALLFAGCSQNNGVGITSNTTDAPSLAKPAGGGGGQPYVAGGGQLEGKKRLGDKKGEIEIESGSFNIVARPVQTSGKKSNYNALVTWQYRGDAGQERQTNVRARVSGRSDERFGETSVEIELQDTKSGDFIKIGGAIHIEERTILTKSGSSTITTVHINSRGLRTQGTLQGHIQFNLDDLR